VFYDNSGVFLPHAQQVLEAIKMKEFLLTAELTNLKSDATTYFHYLF